MMSPLIINIMLDYYCNPEGYDGTSKGSPAYHDAIEFLMKEGMLSQTSLGRGEFEFSITKKGKIWCAALQEIPFPEAVYRVGSKVYDLE